MKTLLEFFGFSFAPIQAIETFRLEILWGWAALVLLLLVFIPVFLKLYRLEDKPCPPGLKYGLLALRILFVAGVLFLLAGPRFVVSGMVPQKNKLAVLIDASRSMSIKEDGIIRIDRVRDTLVGKQLLEKLETKTGVSPSLFAFSGQVSPLSKEEISSFSVTPDGNQTNLSRAVTEVISILGADSLLGILLLTDGAHNHGDNPINALTTVRTPLYFLGAGKSGLTKDLGVSLERPPAIGFLNAKLRIKGEVRTHNIATDTISVEVRKDGALQETIKVAIGNDHRGTFHLNIPCDAEGTFNYAAAIPRLEGELTYDNNESGFLLKVIKERLKILALANAPNWDLTFLKGVARSDPNAHFDAFVQVSENRWLSTEDYQLKGNQPFPDLKALLEETDILVLRGLPEARLAPFAEAIQKRLESGKMGLLLFPSDKTLGQLGYPGSKMAELFPVELTGESWRGTPGNLVLPVKDTPYGFLKLLDDPVENQEFYRTLPRFDGLYLYSRRKAGSEVLLSSTLETNAGAAPALLFQRVGRGNVAMFLGGPLWPMGFKLIPSGKGIKPYTAFILNLLKWLANRREDAQVTLDLASSRAFIGQPMTLRVWVSDTHHQPLDSAQVNGTISDKDGQTNNLVFVGSPEKGCYETTLLPTRRGRLDIKVEAHHQGKLLGESKGQLLVELPTVEFDDPELRTDLMTKLASSTGGLYLPIEQASELAAHLKPIPGQKRETHFMEIRDNPFILLLMLLFPLSEWFLRRHRGYS